MYTDIEQPVNLLGREMMQEAYQMVKYRAMGFSSKKVPRTVSLKLLEKAFTLWKHSGVIMPTLECDC